MIKEMLTGAAVVFFAVGAYQLTSAFQWPTPNKNWRQTEGWLTGAGSEHSLGVPGKAGAVLEFFGKSKPLMQIQHVSFVYFVNGSLYFKRLELPLNLSPFFEAMKQGNKQAKPSTMSAFEEEDTEMSLARFNEETKKLEVCTDPGTKMEVVVGRHLSTTYTEQKWEEVPRSSWDRYMPKVLVKYNPANLNQSITEPDLLDGASNLLWSGICFIGLSALLGAGVVYDNLATKPEPEPTPFQRRR
jgi:hypothetical protein